MPVARFETAVTIAHVIAKTRNKQRELAPPASQLYARTVG